MKATKQADLVDYMRGYARNPHALKLLTSGQDWSVHARMELERRRAVFLGTLPDELLEGIASGELSIPELAKQISR